MICKKCKKEIADDSIFCNYCGKKQATEARKTLRRANGMESIYKLSGRRRTPWVAAISANIDGVIKQRAIGYFTTRQEAEEALVKHTMLPSSLMAAFTLSEIREEWMKQHYKELTKKGEESYNSAWLYYKPFHNTAIREMKTADFQRIIDDAEEQGKSRSTCEKIKQLGSQLCKFAMQNDVISKNYASFVVLAKSGSHKKERFTDEEIKILWVNSMIDTVKIILILIYTGMRINELFDTLTENVHFADEKDIYNYLIAGNKTEAGRDRVIPINKKILPIIRRFASKQKKYLITNKEGNRMDASNFRDNQFYPVLLRLGILQYDDGNPPSENASEDKERTFSHRLTPHCTRHTFASLMAKNNANQQALKEIIGHEKYETVSELYAHTDLQQLSEAVELI